MLNQHYNDRLDACQKLEAASVELIEKVVKLKRKLDKQSGKTRKQVDPGNAPSNDVEKGLGQWRSEVQPTST